MHQAIIAKIDSVEEIPGANTIQIGYVLGETVVIGKDTNKGDVGIYFPCDLQLSSDYCRYNNLYRNSPDNLDSSKKGFFDDNRRVRAQKFMKVRSDGYFAPLSSLDFTNTKQTFLVGDKFNYIKGNSSDIEICRKYINIRLKTQGVLGQKKKIKFNAPFFKEHVDTEQFKYYINKIPVGSLLSFHAKTHGTSARYAHTVIKQPPRNLWERLLTKLGLYEEERWEKLAGTRRVVLRGDRKDKEGFHGSEQWRFDWLEKLSPHLDKGITVYGEIVGYANGSPIMGRHNVDILKDKNYTKKYGNEIVYKYNCLEGTNRFIIYRITYTTADGKELDMTVDQLCHWCKTRDLEHTMEVYPRLIYNGDTGVLLKIVTLLTEREEHLTEDYYDPSHVLEGIVIRVDDKHTRPTFYKNKSWAFKVLEGIWKEDNVDIEDAQSEEVINE